MTDDRLPGPTGDDRPLDENGGTDERAAHQPAA